MLFDKEKMLECGQRSNHSRRWRKKNKEHFGVRVYANVLHTK